MNHFIGMITGAVLLLFCTSSVCAEELTPSKKADIQKLLEVINVSRMADQLGTLTVQSLRQSLRSCNNCTPQTFDVIEHETLGLYRERRSAKNGLNERMVTIYGKHFSHAEIRQLLAFYATTLGKRLLTESPLISQEGLIAGQRWGQSLTPDLESRFRAAFAKAKLPMPTISSSSQTQ
jgi:uncharacterized protein